jgi:hypothetical protein
MSKRLKYTKDILTHMLGNGQVKQRGNNHEKNVPNSSSMNKFTTSVDNKGNSINYQTNPINLLGSVSKFGQNTLGTEGLFPKYNNYFS